MNRSIDVATCDPVWRRALLSRTRERLRRENRGAKARAVLVALLRRAGVDASLVTIHAWPRQKQGDAYLWAIAFLSGREDLPPPFNPEGPDGRS